MAYCTLDDLKEKISEDELIQLTDDEGTGVIVTSRTDRAMEDASSEIDAYASGRYQVPLDPVPPVIRKFAVDLAIYNLLQRREGADEDRQRDYANAIAFLKNVSEGKVTLGVTPRPDPAEEASGTTGITSTRTKVFDTDFMAKY